MATIRRTITLPENVDTDIRKHQIQLMTTNNIDISFSAALVQLVRLGLGTFDNEVK